MMMATQMKKNLANTLALNTRAYFRKGVVFMQFLNMGKYFMGSRCLTKSQCISITKIFGRGWNFVATLRLNMPNKWKAR
jgi:hypothetical protein